VITLIKTLFDEYKVYKTITPKSSILWSIPDANDPIYWKGDYSEENEEQYPHELFHILQFLIGYHMNNVENQQCKREEGDQNYGYNEGRDG
jgi:hypothetical protein